jgi:hypothetical protein
VVDYTKTTWIDESEPAIDADNLNKIENGIYNNSQNLKELAQIISLGGQIYI